MSLNNVVTTLNDMCNPSRMDCSICSVGNPSAAVGIGAKFSTAQYKYNEGKPNAVCPVQVYSVAKGSTADYAGLKTGDILLEVIQNLIPKRL